MIAIAPSTPIAHVNGPPREPCAIAIDRKSTRLNSSHVSISYAVFCLKKKKIHQEEINFNIELNTIFQFQQSEITKVARKSQIPQDDDRSYKCHHATTCLIQSPFIVL